MKSKWIAIAIIVFLAIALFSFFSIYSIGFIQTDSMEPTFSECTMLVINHKADIQTIKVGDIVEIDVSGSDLSVDTIAHRVIENDETKQQIATRADNTAYYSYPNAFDGYFAYSDIKGRVDAFFKMPQFICDFRIFSSAMKPMSITITGNWSEYQDMCIASDSNEWCCGVITAWTDTCSVCEWHPFNPATQPDGSIKIYGVPAGATYYEDSGHGCGYDSPSLFYNKGLRECCTKITGLPSNRIGYHCTVECMNLYGVTTTSTTTSIKTTITTTIPTTTVPATSITTTLPSTTSVPSTSTSIITTTSIPRGDECTPDGIVKCDVAPQDCRTDYANYLCINGYWNLQSYEESCGEQTTSTITTTTSTSTTAITTTTIPYTNPVIRFFQGIVAWFMSWWPW